MEGWVPGGGYLGAIAPGLRARHQLMVKRLMVKRLPKLDYRARPRNRARGCNRTGIRTLN